MRYLLMIVFILALSEVSTEAFTITHIAADCTRTVNGGSLTGPGISIGAGEGGACSGPELAPGDTVSLSWFVGDPAGGTVDGMELFRTHACPIFQVPCGYLSIDAHLTVTIPRDAVDQLVTVQGIASGSGEFFFADTNHTTATYPFSGIGTGTATLSRTLLATYTLSQATAGLTAVPEPATLLLFGTGLTGLAVWRWRKATQLCV